MSVPIEQVAIILSLGRARSSASRQLTTPRELMRTSASRARAILSSKVSGRRSWSATTP